MFKHRQVTPVSWIRLDDWYWPIVVTRGASRRQPVWAPDGDVRPQRNAGAGAGGGDARPLDADANADARGRRA